MKQEFEKLLGEGLNPGDHHYRAFVGPPEKYDLISSMQFNILTRLGLREHHYLLDIGCGSLRAGKLFIPYLLPGRYFGIEPEQWLIEEGVKSELGQDIIRIKRPTFSNNSNFTLSIFGKEFDFLVAQSIFSHASAKQIIRCLSEAGKVMHETSIFAATFVRGEENYAGDEWVYPGCVHYTPDYMKNLVQQSGLACTPHVWQHPNSAQSWIFITDPSNIENIPPLHDLVDVVFLENQLAISRERLARLEKLTCERLDQGREGHIVALESELAQYKQVVDEQRDLLVRISNGRVMKLLNQVDKMLRRLGLRDWPMNKERAN
jgi:hypothetical protein